MRRQRYLEKLEKFEEEYEFIKGHEIEDDVTLGHSCIHSKYAWMLPFSFESPALHGGEEVSLDIVAMLTKDLGITVEDDYTNIGRLREKDVLSKGEISLLRVYNGLRNTI